MVSTPKYLKDRAGFANDKRSLKDLARLEDRMSREGTGWIKEFHRIGDDGLWTIYVGSRRLLIRQSPGMIELMGFGEHDDAYMDAERATYGPLPSLPPSDTGPDPAPARSAEVHTPLLANISDDTLGRLGVGPDELQTVRSFRFETDIYTEEPALGVDLVLRLAECLVRPPMQVLADYEARGRDDAAEEVLTEFANDVQLAQDDAQRARSAATALERALAMAHAENNSLRSQAVGSDRLTDLEASATALTKRIPELIQLTSEALARAEAAERRAAAAQAQLVTREPARQMRRTEPTTAPGRSWNGERGSDRWRLSASEMTMSRLTDGATLAEIVGVEAARVLVKAFLSIRPSGGRVWVDDYGHATTQLDGRTVSLGSLSAAATAMSPTDDGTLRFAISRALSSTPHSTAREIAFQLTRDGVKTTRSEVNSIVYRDHATFAKDDSAVPRWRLCLARTSSIEASSQSHKNRWSVQDRDTYAHLVDQAQAAPPVPLRPTHARAAEQPPAPKLDLMVWQREAIAAWYANGCHGIIEAVTGTGKTHVGLEAVAHAAARGERSTVLVPSVDLQDQWTARFATFLPALRLAQLGGRSTGDPDRADVTIAVVNSATKTDLSAIGRSSLIVADEVHRYGAEGFQVALRAGYRRRLGLTATLERSDDAIEAVLNPYFSGTQLVVGFDRAIREEVVAPFRLILAPVTMTEEEREEYDDLSQKISSAIRALRSQGALGSNGGLLQQITRLCGASGQVGRAARTATSAMRGRRRLLAHLTGKLDAVEELAERVAASQGAVLFTQTKEVAEEAAIRLRAWRVAASALHSDMSAAERGEALHGLATGALQALAAPKLLDEGIDLPSVDLGIVMTASRSRRQMVQRLGRVIRRKSDGRPVDFVILFAAGTVEDPSDESVHEGFFNLVGEVATNRLLLEPGWTADQL